MQPCCSNFIRMKRRNTPAKQQIRALLEEAGSPMSQDMMEARLQGGMDRVTIYRVLAGFCEDGVLHRVTADDGKAYYALCTGCKPEEHHHDHAHFRCQRCRKIECLPTPAQPELPAGYLLQSMNFWISGYCAACGPGAA